MSGGELPMISGLSISATESASAEFSVQGHHLHAARRMLGWPLHILADMSQLSPSTLRRLEEDTAAASQRSLFKVVSALKTGGIRFVRINGRVVGVALVSDLASACLHP